MKKVAESRVIPAIRQVLGGRYYVSDRMQDKIMVQFAGRMPSRRSPVPRASLTQLSDRELEVFELHGRAVSTREMAAAMAISPKTVATHRRRIKTKLAIESTRELVRQAVLWIESEQHEAAQAARSSRG
jgi:DNA-binding NarL/FixJ family response regulator